MPFGIYGQCRYCNLRETDKCKNCFSEENVCGPLEMDNLIRITTKEKDGFDGKLLKCKKCGVEFEVRSHVDECPTCEYCSLEEKGFFNDHCDCC